MNEIRRCLLEADVAGIVRAAPAYEALTAAEAFLALHMARVEAQSIPLKLRQYSLALLREHGIFRDAESWIKGEPQKPVVAEAVGIASSSSEPGFANLIVGVMSDALNNARAKGIVEPLEQRETMLTARRKFKFKLDK